MDENRDDLVDTLTLTKISRRDSAAGAWVSGTIADHRFDALVFPEHAESESYELGTSKISKLWLQRLSDKTTVVNFDRGWDVRPTDDLATRIMDFLAAGLADTVFGN
jgi:hypothetical protein